MKGKHDFPQTDGKQVEFEVARERPAKPLVKPLHP
jgi:hypothetical protein